MVVSQVPLPHCHPEQREGSAVSLFFSREELCSDTNAPAPSALAPEAFGFRLFIPSNLSANFRDRTLAGCGKTHAYAAFERIREAAPIHAEKWLTGLFDAIFSLDEIPARCPVIPEAKELGYPARHLLYGKGRGVYRIIFHIREDEQLVRVLRVWHASRDAVISADLED